MGLGVQLGAKSPRHTQVVRVRHVNPQTRKPANPQTYKPINPQTHKPTNPQTHQPTNPPTHLARPRPRILTSQGFDSIKGGVSFEIRSLACNLPLSGAAAPRRI